MQSFLSLVLKCPKMSGLQRSCAKNSQEQSKRKGGKNRCVFLCLETMNQFNLLFQLRLRGSGGPPPLRWPLRV